MRGLLVLAALLVAGLLAGELAVAERERCGRDDCPPAACGDDWHCPPGCACLDGYCG